MGLPTFYITHKLFRENASYEDSATCNADSDQMEIDDIFELYEVENPAYC